MSRLIHSNRVKILCVGYEKVKSECTFEKRMNKILSGML